MLARVHEVATAAWTVVAAGAGLGFVARDLLGLGRCLVALAWIGGGLAGLIPALCRLGKRRRQFGPRRRRARTAASAEREPGEAEPAGEAGRRASTAPGERGQATVEWVGLVLLASIALGALASFVARIDGRPFGAFLAHHFVCAVKGDCRDGDGKLVRAYGEPAAGLVREHAPNLVYESGERQLPVDWRRCREPACADAPDEADLDVHRSDAGERATVFTHVLRRSGRTYIQYWFYYPDSNTTWAGSDKAWEVAWLIPRVNGIVADVPPYPGFHEDDWEGYVVRLEPDGSAWARASSHGHWRSCKKDDCTNDWIGKTGWTRVSRGSHAGHIPLDTDLDRGDRRFYPRLPPVPLEDRDTVPPVRRRLTPLLPGRDLRERTTTGEGLRLIPLETLDRRRYRPRAEAVQPPWNKEAYRDPESDRS